MRYVLIILVTAALAVGCGSDSNPRAVDIKPDTRLKRVGEGAGGPQGKVPDQNAPALP